MKDDGVALLAVIFAQLFQETREAARPANESHRAGVMFPQSLLKHICDYKQGIYNYVHGICEVPKLFLLLRNGSVYHGPR
jgi:hypothetical protein